MRQEILCLFCWADWADCAAEFREKMPSEIAELVNDSSADTSAEDFSKSIHERLKQILDLYKVSRYRSTPDGALAIDMDALVRGNQPRTAEYKPSGNGTLAGGKTDAAVRETVTKAVRQWFQMTLVETVIGIQALQKSQTWNDAEIARATSEEALTAAVMPRYHVYNSVKRELGSKFGKTRGAGVAD